MNLNDFVDALCRSDLQDGRGCIFTGKRTPQKTCVWVNGELLKMRWDLRNHSPDGPEWGYGGSGPAQLALAILAHCFSSRIAEVCYQDFKREMVAPIKAESWEMSSDEVVGWMRKHVKDLVIADLEAAHR